MFLLDIIAPKKCIKCEKIGNYLCKTCLEEIWYHEDICYVCKQKSKNFKTHWYCENDHTYFKQILILTHYKNFNIKYLIKQAKFHHKFEIFDDFAKYLITLLQNNLDTPESQIILIPAPMFFLKKLWRWYNQAEILTKKIAKYWNYEYNSKIIKKIKHTKPQSHLSKVDRIINLQNTFKINLWELEKYKNHTFVIVDDVISTWTTFVEISKILKKHWITKIIWLSIASW